MTTIQTWIQLGSGPVSAVLLAAVGYFWLGGRRKAEADSSAQKTTSEASLVDASVAGFKAAMTSNEEILSEYRKMITEVSMLRAEVSTLRQGQESIKKQLDSTHKELQVCHRKNKQLAKLVIHYQGESKIRQNVIDSLVLMMESARDGAESVEGVMAKSTAVLNDFLTKYGKVDARVPQVSAFVHTLNDEDTAMAADLLSEVLTDTTEEEGV